jgi:RND family efflux transporter MFP subunit
MIGFTKILEPMKSLRLWAIVVIVIVVAGGGYYGFTSLGDSGVENATSETQLVPVTRGDLVNDISVNGTLTYTTRETLTFGQQGFVSDVTVEEGQRVSAGDALAVLDAETIANLEKAVAQARINVRNAEDALEDARNPYTPAQIAKAESDVANAQVALQNADEALTELTSPSSENVAKARIAVLNAQTSLEKAAESRDNLVTPTVLTIAKAESAVTSARIALQNAQEDLDTLLDPTDGDVAKARSAVANSRIALENARDGLQSLTDPSAGDIAKAESGVSNARISLDNAKTSLETLTNPTAVDVAKAELAAANAQLSFEAAQEAVEDATSAATVNEIGDLQTELSNATANLANAQFDFSTAERNSRNNIQAAADALATAREDYAGIFRQWLGMDITSFDSPPDEIFSANGIDLAAIFDDSQTDAIQRLFQQGQFRDDPATPWNEIVVYSWMGLYLGDLLVDCGNLQAGRARACIRDEFDAAWTAVDNTINNLAAVEIQQATAVRNAENAVASAEDTVELRQESLDELIAGLSDSQIKSKVDNLALAKANLDIAQDDLVQLTGEPDPLDIESKQSAVATAEANLADAVDALAALTGEPDPLDLESKQTAVATAEANLADAVETLASLTGDPDELTLASKQGAVATAEANLVDAETALSDLLNAAGLDVELANREIEVAQANLANAEEALAPLLGDVDPLDLLVRQTAVRLAVESLVEKEDTLAEYSAVDDLIINLRQTDLVASRATLDTAVADLDGVTLRAPFDGIVSLVNIEAGQQVNGNTQAIEIVDPSVVEVSGSVDEIDVLFLQNGAPAFVTLEALGNEPLEGLVSSIANAGTSNQGIVTYPVTIRVNSPQGVQLPEGLSATAQVIIREQTDSILIPLQALYGSVQEPVVKIVSGNDIIERQVTLGISDDFWIVVEDGLNEGETISMEVIGSATTGFGGIGATFRAVGGFGGGGFRGPGGGGGGGQTGGGGGGR